MPRDEPRAGDGNAGRASARHRVERRLLRLRDELLTLQTLLRSKETFAVALIVTGIPAAGRTEIVNRLLEWLDPKYVAVHAFDEESANGARPPMWRYWQALPARGRINLYFGGWYGDYIGEMMHGSKRAQRRADRALERIVQLETMLSADGVRTLKIFLQIPQKLQQRRLAKLREQKLTRWRVTREDLWLARHYGRVQKIAARFAKHGMVVAFEGMDAAGKGGAIRSGARSRGAAGSRSSIAAGMAGCWSSACAASRVRPTGGARTARSTSSSASSASMD